MNQRIYHSVTLEFIVVYRVFSNRCSILQDIDSYVKKKREPYNRGSILFNLFSFFTVCRCFKTIYIFKPRYEIWKKIGKALFVVDYFSGTKF